MTATTTHTGAVELTVGQVAEQLGVTVRTLHHYDEVGLLTPSARTSAGYRLYTGADLERLRTVVVYRRLGFGLDEVRELLDGDVPVVEHLRRQRAAVITRLDELGGLVAAIDRALEHAMAEQPATTEDLRELFGDGFSEDYQQEAEQRWGATDAWRQSAARTKRYTKGDWELVKAEQKAVESAFVAAMDAGLPPTSEMAMDAAEAHRRSIHDRFYDCSSAMHRGLADLYLADPRFTRTYENIKPGMAQYVHDAIHANADRAERRAGSA